MREFALATNAAQSVRIDSKRLLFWLCATLLIPMGMALTLDVAFGWLPFATIAASVLFIPLSTFFVVRVTLAEMNRVLAIVAPTVDSDDEIRNEIRLDEANSIKS